MDPLNKYDNRAKTRASQDSNYAVNANAFFTRAVSVDENIRVEIHAAPATYGHAKTETGIAPLSDEASPNASVPPSDETWDLKGYRSLHGYVVLDAAQTVDVQLWALDPTNDDWMLVATVANVPSYQQFRFADGVLGRTVWLRFVNIGNTITTITARCSPE